MRRIEDELEVLMDPEWELEDELEVSRPRLGPPRAAGGPARTITIPPVVICTGPASRIVDGFRVDQSGLRRDAQKNHFAEVEAIARAVVATWLTAAPVRTICVEGHTDARASDDYNFRLGLRRARTVRAALFSAIQRQSIRVRRPDIPARINLVPSSAGEQSPRADNATEAGRARNRRVEIFFSTADTITPRTPPRTRRTPPDPGLGSCLRECEREFSRCRETGEINECRRARKRCEEACRGIVG